VDAFRHGDLSFPVTDAGPADGETVLLLHGFPQNRHSWTTLASRLHAAGYRTLAPDQRGYSAGARPRRRRDYRIGELVADTDALISAAGRPRVHLVGHDWGAVVAWATAARHPERLASLTALSVPHPGAMQRAMLTSNQARHSWYMGLFQLPRVPEALFRPDAPRSRERMVRWLRSYGQTLERAERDLTALGDDGFSAALGWYRAMAWGSLAELRRPITVPTLYAWSDGDKAVTRAAAELCARHVAAPYEFVEFPGASHWIPEEIPDAVAGRLVAHLHRNPSGQEGDSRQERGSRSR
jgi:pimeloyl-ACP methyl ester carboxylesterase